MHPDMAYRIATLRTEEISDRALRPGRPAGSSRRPFWRRRGADATLPTHRPAVLVPVPPPWPGRAPADDDRRAA